MTATIIVETGSIVAGANSYASVATLATYADERGVTIAATDPEDLLIQAMDYIESLEFIGLQLTENQPLSWPRSGAVKKKIYYYDTDEIPQDLIDALCETALSVDAGTSPLNDLERATSKERVGDIEVQYKESSASSTIVKKINAKLKALIIGSGISFIVSKA